MLGERLSVTEDNIEELLLTECNKMKRKIQD
jgi:hypothetical protein